MSTSASYNTRTNYKKFLYLYELEHFDSQSHTVALPGKTLDEGREGNGESGDGGFQFRNDFYVGVRGLDEQLYYGKIVSRLRRSVNLYYIQYNGWSNSHDEWVPENVIEKVPNPQNPDGEQEASQSQIKRLSNPPPNRSSKTNHIVDFGAVQFYLYEGVNGGNGGEGGGEYLGGPAPLRSSRIKSLGNASAGDSSDGESDGGSSMYPKGGSTSFSHLPPRTRGPSKKTLEKQQNNSSPFKPANQTSPVVNRRTLSPYQQQQLKGTPPAGTRKPRNNTNDGGYTTDGGSEASFGTGAGGGGGSRRKRNGDKGAPQKTGRGAASGGGGPSFFMKLVDAKWSERRIKIKETEKLIFDCITRMDNDSGAAAGAAVETDENVRVFKIGIPMASISKDDDSIGGNIKVPVQDGSLLIAENVIVPDLLPLGRHDLWW